MAKKGFNFKPTLAAQFVSEFLDHAPKLRRYSFMFRFPFFLQRIKSFKYFETLTMDFTTTEGNYLVNGAIGHNSTVCGQHYAMWRTLRSPNLRVGIVSKSSLLASMFVSRVKHILETNEKVVKTWSDLIQPKKAEKWNNSEVTLIRPMPLANATFTALGVGTSLAGHHFDILIFDDVVDTDHQSSPILRKRVWDWFRFVAMQTLSTAEETQAHIIGTLYHPDDLYHHIINLEKEGKGNWKCFVQQAINNDGTSFWEDMFPLEKLQEIEATYGTDVFKLQYQNDPEFGGSGLTWDMFEANYYEPDNIDVEKLEVIQGVDLAAPDVVRRAGQSSFAIVVVGLERQTNKFFVLDILKRVGVRMADQRSYIENLYTRYRHTSTIQMEAYAVQSYMHEYLAESEIILPYAKVQTGGTKESRFEHILSLIANNRLYFRQHLHNELLEEIINFPNCSADLIDALYMAIRGFHREPKLRFLSW
jgi:phage terminase large subunit-like protein